MGKVLTQINFLDLELEGTVIECSYEFGHLIDQRVKVGDVLGNRQASFWYNEEDGELTLQFSSIEFVTIACVLR